MNIVHTSHLGRTVHLTNTKSSSAVASVFLLLAICSSQAALADGVSNTVTSRTGTTIFNGTSINQLVGAQTFYDAGYNGSRAIVANIEAGHVWNGHESLTHVSTFLDARSSFASQGLNAGALGSVDDHATAVASVLAGRSTKEYGRGIAYGASLWSGAVATSFNTQSNTFSWSRTEAFTAPYVQALLTGQDGRRADVVNSSWGFSGTSGGASNRYAIALDAITRASARTVVFAAGNSGAQAAAVQMAPAGYNSIVVGGLGDDVSGYRQLADFSSRGLQAYIAPNGLVVPNAIARVDIVAPAQNMTLAYYGGATGSNSGGTDSTNGGRNYYAGNMAGTSFASPIVAAAATLLNDVAYDKFANNPHSHDGQVIKAVLLNSASKPQDWNNAQQLRTDGVIETKQALDAGYGAGALDLSQAYTQFTTGTHDLEGLAGGKVAATGWDYAMVSADTFVDYSFANPLLADTSFTATLNWFVGRSLLDAAAGSVSDDYFTDLSLQLWSVGENGSKSLVAISDADYLNTEHLSILIPKTGRYEFRVNWDGELYDFTGNSAQTFGVAWSSSMLADSVATPVPELSSAWMMLTAMPVLMVIARRRKVELAASLSV